MTALTGSLRRRLFRRSADPRRHEVEAVDLRTPGEDVAPVDIAPLDPLLAYLQSATGAPAGGLPRHHHR